MIPIATPFQHHHRVHLHETDSAGVLFFGQLFTLAHNAYEEWLLNAGLSLRTLLDEGTFAIPLIHASADYHHPIQLHDLLTVTIELIEQGQSSFTLKSAIWTTEGEQSLMGEVTTIHVTTSTESGEAIPLPQTVTEALQRAQQER